MSRAGEEEFALAEYREVGEFVRQYVGMITSTERYAVAGAAAFASFSISGLTEGLSNAQIVLTAIPFVVLALAGLRCLTLYLVIRRAVAHLIEMEGVLLKNPALGFNRIANRDNSVQRAIEVTSGGYWALACLAAIAFWLYANGFV
ncbi:MAG: hypothetical protein AAGB18_08230 [Pseudomonadota bacterium]